MYLLSLLPLRLPTNSFIEFFNSSSSLLSLHLKSTHLIAMLTRHVPCCFLRAILEDKLPKSRVSALLKMYHEHNNGIRQQLGVTSNLAPPSIVGLDWRLDYYIQSNSLDQVRVPVYFLDLKTTQGDGSVKDVRFSCNLQELQDLLAKCKDACNALELAKKTAV